MTSVYGKKYGGMLLALLYSIRVSNPKAKATIFWRDVSKTTRLLEQVFPEFEFINISHSIKGIFIDRIAHKTVLWAEAARRHVGENLIFVDVDMLVRKDIQPFFKESFDIAFTYKDNEVYPINTGTFLTKSTKGIEEFFNNWKEETARITHDPELLRQATTQLYPYGAPDQMAFYTMIGYEKGKVEYTVSLSGGTLRCKGFPCELLNETNSVPISEDVSILHYKGGWHDILLDAGDFTIRRPKEKSWEMYVFYMSMYQQAVVHAEKMLHTKISPRAFGIKRHFYLSYDLKESQFLRSVFIVLEKIMMPVRVFIDRVQRKFFS